MHQDVCHQQALRAMGHLDVVGTGRCAGGGVLWALHSLPTQTTPETFEKVGFFGEEKHSLVENLHLNVL